MFRTGGTPNEGIMHGIVDRKGYTEGSARKTADEVYDLMKEMVPPPQTRLPLGQVGLNLASGQYAGDGFVQNLVRSAKGPYEQWTKADDEKANYDRQLRMMAAKTGVEQQMKMNQIRAQKAEEKSPLYNVYLNQGVERGMSGAEAQRFAAYHTDIQDKLRQKVGSNLIGGIIEDNFNTLSKDQKRKKISKLKKTGMGKYFYDPYDGKIKQLVEMDGQLQWRAFDSVDSIDFSPVSGVATETSTPYQDAQDFREQEKSEGNLLDEDIAAIRGYQESKWLNLFH